jgi:hypothetical protein
MIWGFRMPLKVKVFLWQVFQNGDGRGAVIPDFKDKTRYTPYVSSKSQISHIATNKG